MGYNVGFPAVACTTAVIVLVCLLAYDGGNGIGNVVIAPAAVPNIAIDGLTDICYFDDDDCLSNIDAPPSPSPVARSLISPRALSLDNEMVYLERDPVNPNIKRLYRFQGGCGFQYVRNEIDRYITMWPHLEGGEGITIDDICDPGGAIVISVNTSSFNITAPPSNNIIPSCGVVPTFLNDTTSLALLFVGENGVDVNASCSPGDPISIAFDPAAVNITEVVLAWFGAQCGLAVSEAAGQISIALDLQGLNGIHVTDGCPGESTVNITFTPSDVNAEEVYDEWFVDGCGITHSISGGDIVLAVNATGSNGIVVNPTCGEGDALGLSFDPRAVNMTEAGDLWFIESCGTNVDTSSGLIAISPLIEGGVGITVNAVCAPGDPIIISWDASEVNLTDLVDMVFNGTCGVSVPQNNNTLAITIHIDGENGIVVDDVCAMGEPIVLSWDPYLVNATELVAALFGSSCGFSFTESGGTITGNVLLNGVNGIEVDAVCSPGGSIDLAWNESAVDIAAVVTNWFGAQCGVSVTEDGGTIAVSVNLTGENGIMVDNTCAGGDVILTFNASQVNGSQVYDEWFADGCGITHNTNESTTEISTNIAVTQPLYIDGACGAGDVLVIGLNISALNVSTDIMFGYTCGIMFTDNMGVTEATVLLNGFNGIGVDNACTTNEINITWYPAEVNASEVLDEWFIPGCGIAMGVSGGDIVISANITGSGGVGVTGGCVVGDAVELYFNPSTLNVSEFVDIVIGAQCGVSAIDNAGVIDLKAALDGENGIVIDETCTGLDVIVSWDPVAVNVSQVFDEWFIAGCGIELAESLGDITVSANITGYGGVGVASGCGVGDALELYFDPSTLNVSEFVDVVFGVQCGVSYVEDMGAIDLKVELAGENGIIIDETCTGLDVIVSWDPVNVNVSQVLDEWFIAGCGITLADSLGDIVIGTNVIGAGGVGVTAGCGDGDALEMYFDPSTLNVTDFVDVIIGAQCGVSAIDNAGVVDLKAELNGTNGIIIDETCTGPDVIISWDPVNVNVSQVLDEWFIEGCGIILEESVGDIVVSANITGSGGIGVASGCGVGDSLELFFDSSTMNVSEFVDVVFGAQCGVSAVENAGVIDLKAELAGTNGITIDETCTGPDIVVSWDPVNVNVSHVLDEWFIGGCGIALDESMGDIVISANITGSGGVGVTAGCGVGDALELYFNPSTLNVSEFVDVVFGAQCGVSVVENAGVIDLKTELAGTNGITINETCTGLDVIVGFDPTLTNTTGINNAWFRDTCGVSRSISGGDIGFNLGIVGDGIITVDDTCAGMATSIKIGINTTALNIPNLGSACLIYNNASLAPAAELVRPEGFLFHRIIAEEGCNRRRTHFYIDLPHAPLGFGMLIGVNNIFSGAGVRSSSILGGENNVVAGGSQFTTTLNGQNHAVNIAGSYGLIGGGNGHILNGVMNVALMGTTHTLHAQSSHSSVMNGINNVVGPFTGPSIRQFMTINNGLNNVVKSAFSSIHNGVGNLIEDGAAAISGGVILTGSVSIVRGTYSVILGATDSTNNGRTSLIGVGDLHFISNTAVYGAIVGGERHVVQATSGGVFVGYSCTVSTGGTNSWIGGGRFNNVLGLDAFILGGNTNVNNAARSGIGAGRNHNIGVLATDSFILAGDGVVLSLATDSFTAASKHLLAVGALRTSGISTSNGGVWNLAFGSYFYINTNNGATIRLPTTMPEGTKFVIRNESTGAVTTQCSSNGCTLCPQGSACALNGSMNIAARTAVSFIFIGNNYHVL